MANVVDLLRLGTDRHPDKVFLYSQSRNVSYAELGTAVARVARLLKAGGAPSGEAAGVIADDPLMMVATILACSTLDMTVLPLASATAPARLEENLEACAVRCVVTDVPAMTRLLPGRKTIGLPSLDELLAPPRLSVTESPKANHVLTYFPSSGSTGRPKYVMTTDDASAKAAHCNAESFATTDDDVYLSALPLTHSYGLGGVVWPALAAGVSLAILSRFTPRGLLELAHKTATVVFAVPTMYDLILRADQERLPRLGLDRVRLFVWGGAPCSASTIQEYHARFGIYLTPNYGSVEAWGLTSCLDDSLESCLETVGYPQVGVELWTADPNTGRRLPRGEVGEVVARGPGVGLGYLGEPAATAEVFRAEGCYTGDIGYVDERGRLRLMGRKKRILKRGGNSVSPEEIELCLLTLDGVHDAYVTERRGKAGNDLIVALLGTPRRLSAADVMNHLGSRLEKYKVPQIVLLADHLPRNDRHKIDVPKAEALVDVLLGEGAKARSDDSEPRGEQE